MPIFGGFVHLYPAKPAAGMEYAALVIVIGNIIGPFLELGTGISHSDAEEG